LCNRHARLLLAILDGSSKNEKLYSREATGAHRGGSGEMEETMGGGARPERRSTSVNWDVLVWSWTVTRIGVAAPWTWLRDVDVRRMIPASCKVKRGAFRHLRTWRRRTRHREGMGRDGSLDIDELQITDLDSLGGREEN
jgi:hypothetical protein